MSDKVKVMALRNKTNPDRYLAASADDGDWSDPNLDVTINNIQCAYLIIRKDLSEPTLDDLEEHRIFHEEHKRRLIEKFGEHAFVSLDFEGASQHYDPVVIEITREQFEDAFDNFESTEPAQPKGEGI